MSIGAEEATRLRKARFSAEENYILIQEVRTNYSKLYGAESKKMTVAERRRVWESIAAKINAISSWKRTGQEVQKRWNDCKRRTKEKLIRILRLTQGASDGSVSEEALTSEEEMVSAILGPEVVSVVVGVDTTDPADPEDPVAILESEQPTMAPTSIDFSTHAVPSSDVDVRSAHPAELYEPLPSPPELASQALYLPNVGHPSTVTSSRPPPEQPPVEDVEDCSPGPSGHLPHHHCQPHIQIASISDPTLDFLQAQRETTEAIRELGTTVRESIDKLCYVVASILPLVQHRPILESTGVQTEGAHSGPPQVVSPLISAPATVNCISSAHKNNPAEVGTSSSLLVETLPDSEALTIPGGSVTEQELQQEFSMPSTKKRKLSHSLPVKRRGR
ncbi:myb-related transcription factor, partner of profilin-like [Latimeria chalumnae]|uniref:myb-related transcription factor, partner of profilin-like n=1 Tax=Latimeria chalumnae TaxID=7897 RepID=UPI0003C1870F|nr:PREDICTED: myb-related transcription factor, partner of profilin-like [Latimeria chalumnae]|eukprot:XP_005987661.1 PREDICTED: myb-related transcription factor, partner of profilin-like [Latimeria chalumnae]